MSEIERQQEEILRTIEERITELKSVKQLLVKAQKDLKCANIEIQMLRDANDKLVWKLKDLTNELCHKCGKYKNDHLGACDTCKWKDVKHWEVD